MCIFSDDLDKISQKLVSVAKDNGSTDNITIVVVFLKPVSELAERAESSRDEVDADDPILYNGITSTSVYINNPEAVKMMNGSSNENLSSNGTATEDASNNNNNPFSSPSVGELGSTTKVGAFDSPLGGGVVFGDSPMASDPFKMDSSGMTGVVDGDFKSASPSMFDQSLEDSKGERKSSTDDVVDFMANQADAWINNTTPTTASVASAVANPFMLKGDSGFISPACTSNNQSASSEDSAENHADREASPGSPTPPVVVTTSSSKKEEEIDEEELESIEVTRLLASSAGSAGGAPASLDDLMKSASRETPTPPIDEDNNGERRANIILIHSIQLERGQLPDKEDDFELSFACVWVGLTRQS